VSDALDRLRQTIPAHAKTARSNAAKRTKAASHETKKTLTRAEFDQHLLAIGLISQLPDTEADFDDPEDEPIKIKGEPLSKTVIRERR
jgi:hypothetical protein